MSDIVFDEIDELKTNDVIKDYAIGGAFAILFYTEPFFTSDIDIFYLPKEKDGLIASLSPIYDYLKNKGYEPYKEHIVKNNTYLQFVPIYDDLIMEAFVNSIEQKYKGHTFKTFTPEYLVAIGARTGRYKDKIRIDMMLKQSNINRDLLDCILCRHGLKL